MLMLLAGACAGKQPSFARSGSRSTTCGGAIIPCGHNGAAGLFHLPCWADERTKGPLRPAGLEGDSLDDFK